MSKVERRIPFFWVNRQLRRGNKWILILIVFLMAVAFVNLIFISSLFNGIVENTNNQVINTFSGHLTIFPAPDQDFINDTDLVLEKIMDTARVQAACPEIMVPGTLKYKNIKDSWQIMAIDPAKSKQVTNVADKMIEGFYLEEDDKDSIIIGRQIAGGEDVEDNIFSFKDAAVGDKITLSFAGIEKELTIKGIFYTKFIDTDSRAFITQSALQEISPDFANKANYINIRLDKKGNEEEVRKELADKGISGNIYTWEEMSGLMDQITDSFMSIDIIFTFVGMLIAAVTIFIVIYIDISDKRQQIGILRAIGIKPYLIRGAYVIQTVVYSTAGIILGSILFFGIIVPYFNVHPFEMPIGDSTLVIDWVDFVARFESVILVSILAGFIPAIHITRIKILDAIWKR